MTEDTELTHSERALAYYGNDLSPEEKAEFEVHLPGCEECQKLLADARELLPAAEAILAFQPKHTVEEQVRLFDAQVRAEQAQRVRRYRYVGLALAAAIAAVIGIAAFEALKPVARPAQKMYAPSPP
jgi:anti-sigma factor RsiW